MFKPFISLIVHTKMVVSYQDSEVSGTFETRALKRCACIPESLTVTYIKYK